MFNPICMEYVEKQKYIFLEFSNDKLFHTFIKYRRSSICVESRIFMTLFKFQLTFLFLKPFFSSLTKIFDEERGQKSSAPGL